MVWDIGTYELIEGNYYKGKLHIFLEGRKLKGEWMLVNGREPGRKNWFLMKTGSPMKPVSTAREDASALTGRTMPEIARDQIAQDGDAQWHSNRTDVPGVDLDSLPRSSMESIEPMACQLVTHLPEGDGWQYEIKFDGYRAQAIKNGKTRATLVARKQRAELAFSQHRGSIPGGRERGDHRW